MKRLVLILMLLAMPSLAEAAGCAGTGSCFWVLGSGNWSDTTHWATTSGGATTGSIPTATDDAIFDSLSNTTAYTITIDATTKTCKNLNFSAAPSISGTITWAGSVAMTISGNMTLLNGMTRTYTGALTLNGTGSQTITMNSVSLAGNVTLNGVGGTWQLQDAFTSTLSINLTNGTLDTNNKAVSIFRFATVAGTKTLTLGTTVMTLTNAFCLNNGAPTNFTVTANTGTLKCTDSAGASKTITSGGSNWNGASLYINPGADTATWTITGASTWNDFKDDGTGNHTITFPNSTTTVTTMTFPGTASKLITLQRTGASGTWTLSATTGNICPVNVSISNSTASGGATFNAVTSTDGGGNTGWNFTSCQPAGYSRRTFIY